jgi:hypothetical protein
MDLLEAQSTFDRIPLSDKRARIKSQVLIDQIRLKVSMAKAELFDLEADLKPIKPIPRSSQTKRDKRLIAKRQVIAKRRIAKRQARIERLRVQRRKLRKAAEREAEKQVIAAQKIEINKAKFIVDACQLDVFAAKNVLDSIPKTDKVARQKATALIHQAQAKLSMAKAELCRLQDKFKPVAPPQHSLPAPAPKYKKPEQTLSTPDKIYLPQESERSPIGEIIDFSFVEPLCNYLKNPECDKAKLALEQAIYVLFTPLCPNLANKHPFKECDFRIKVTDHRRYVTFSLFHAFGEPNHQLFFIFCATIEFEQGEWYKKMHSYRTVDSLDRINLIMDLWFNPDFDWDLHLGRSKH